MKKISNLLQGIKHSNPLKATRQNYYVVTRTTNTERW